MLSVITCTGGRPNAFELCELYMARQDYVDGIQWIISDDCVPPTWISPSWKYRDDIEIEHVRPFPQWQPGQNTLARNLVAALAKVKHDKILFLEDDDWYAPFYFETMDGLLSRAPLAGQVPARYYNVATRQYREFENERHASLGQTGIRAELIPQLIAACNSGMSIDMALWRNNAGLLKIENQVVGIKGMPGRPGIGVGHRPNGRWSRDPQIEVLRSWIGADAELYAEFGVYAEFGAAA